MNGNFNKVISSPIRWAGSKKKLLNEMLDGFFPRKAKNYVEPFLGSGTVLINVLNNENILKYENYYVNDINSSIINFYNILKNNPTILISGLKKLEKEYNSISLSEKEMMYYKLRNKYNNSKTTLINKTIIFYFLMKTGFNGVYRENSKGLFNVPFGKKEFISINYENLIKISELIQNVHFYNLDYKEFFLEMKEKGIYKNSFTYCDPPYLPEDNSITRKVSIYTKDSFDHLSFFEEASKINKVMISLAQTKNSDGIYLKGKFQKKEVNEIVRTINPNKIFNSVEIAYINYKIDQ